MTVADKKCVEVTSAYVEVLNHTKSRGSAVGIVTDYGLTDRGCRRSSPVGSFLDGEGRQADHPLPTSAEAKKMYICTSTS
jgi:hypothetical protein